MDTPELIYVVREVKGSLLSAHYGQLAAIFAAIKKVFLSSGDSLCLDVKGDQIDICLNDIRILEVLPVSLHKGSSNA